VTFRAQSGELIEGIWHQGSFDVALAATDLDGARAEIDNKVGSASLRSRLSMAYLTQMVRRRRNGMIHAA
jgi:hypothetical protein